MTVRNVKKNLAGQQDLLPGLGPYEQIRRGQTVIVDGPAKSYFDLFVRSYAEAGLPVKGTFEDGCTLDAVDDIAIYLAEGKGYSYSGALPHTIDGGETPVGNPSWVARAGNTLRADVSIPKGPIGVASLDEAKSILGFSPSRLPVGEYDIGTTIPDYEIVGPGELISNGVTTGGADLSYNPARESVFFTPATYQREKQGINYPPPRGPDYIASSYNCVFSLGSKLQDHSKNIRYNVVFGNLNGSAPIEWCYNDVFGGNAAAYAGRIERNTIVGSESMAWLGAPDQAWLLEYQHDWFRQPEKPGDPGWDADGLETQFPGIGARIDAFAGYATTEEQSSVNTTLGRDSGNHLIKGSRNFFGGYRAGAQVFAGDSNTGVGTQALEHMVFGDRNTAFGDKAGYSCLDSFGAVFYGYGAGRTLEDASESIVIGNLAADNHKRAKKSIIIGSAVATGIPAGQLDDALCIGMTATIPLLSGDFVKAGAGVNIQPKKIRARQHVRYSDSGSVLTPRPGLLVEGSSSSNMTIEADATGFCTLALASPSNTLIGGIQYNNGSNNLDIITNGTPQVRLESGTCFRPNGDNNQACGRTAFRWSTFYAGTGAINTSDGREKSAPLPITNAMMDAIDSVDIVLYQWLSSIAKKGADNARWHFGAIAQAVRDAFAAHGLDGRDYGLLCYDEWEDEFEEHAAEHEEIPAVTQEVDGEIIEITPANQRLVKEAHTVQTVVAGNRWGLRPDQCMWLLAAAARRRAERAEDRIRVIEEKIAAAGW